MSVFQIPINRQIISFMYFVLQFKIWEISVTISTRVCQDLETRVNFKLLTLSMRVPMSNRFDEIQGRVKALIGP